MKGARIGLVRLGAACLLLIAQAAVQPACAAAVSVDVERNVDAIDVRASALLSADAATAWRVLTDYERYAEFIPDLRLSRVIARRGATVTVEQSGEAALWSVKIPVHVVFEIDELAPGALQSRAVAGSLGAFSSRYVLTPVASGMRMDYVGRLTPESGLVGRIELTALEQNSVRQFQALADEIDRQGAQALARSVRPAR